MTRPSSAISVQQSPPRRGWRWPHAASLVGAASLSVACGMLAPLDPLNRAQVDASPAAGGEWTRQFGSGQTDNGVAVAGGPDGSVYVAGATVGVLPGQVSVGNGDAFLRKYDSSGNELWTRQFGSAAFAAAAAVVVDKDGNVYVAGYVNAALPAQATVLGATDGFLRKYDSAGVEQWTRQFGSDGADTATALSPDANGNVYVAGFTDGALPGQTSAGAEDGFVRKYDSAGNELWTRQFGSSGNDSAYGVSSDENGEVYVAGTVDGELASMTNPGDRDVFLRKYDDAGSEQWRRQFGTTSDDYAFSVAAAAGSVYVAGGTGGTLPGQVSTGIDDAFLRKYDAAGSDQWTEQFGTAAGDVVWALSPDGSGGVYVAGRVGDSAEGAALPGQASAGLGDAFVRNYDSSGNPGFTEQFGSSGDDSALAVYAAPGVVLLAGSTGNALPGQSWFGGVDAFVTRLLR